MSKHFTDKELNCRCGCGMRPDVKMVAKLEEIRAAFGGPIAVTSVARCAQYNRKVGGSRFSAHWEGKAADLVRTPELADFIMANLDTLNIWIERLEHTPTWIHVQVRPLTSGRTFIP